MMVRDCEVSTTLGFSIPLQGAENGRIIGRGARSTAVAFTSSSREMVDIVATSTPSMLHCDVATATGILRDSESKIIASLGNRAVSSNYFVADGPNGPAIHRTRPYIHGLTLKEMGLRQILSSETIIEDLVEILSRSRHHLFSTGTFPDLGGCQEGGAWERRVRGRIPVRSTNIVIADVDGHAYLFDCEADPDCFDLQKARSFKRVASLLSVGLGLAFTELFLRVNLQLRSPKTTKEKQTSILQTGHVTS